MKPSITLLFVCATLVQAMKSHSDSILIEGNLNNWQNIKFVGETQYRQIMDIEQGVVIRAESLASASALEYSNSINLNKTPVLRWQWTVDKVPYRTSVDESGLATHERNQNETKPDGDDFALRVIVGIDPVFGDPKQLHYVWSSREPIGSHWQLDKNNQVLVVSGEDQQPMEWQTLQRHVQKDWQKVFGEEIDELDFIRLQTDSDHIQGHAIGYYGDMETLAIK